MFDTGNRFLSSLSTSITNLCRFLLTDWTATEYVMLLKESFCHLVLIWIKCAHKWKLDGSEIKRSFLSHYKGWTHRKGTLACRPNDHHLQVVAYEPLNQVTLNHKNQLPVGPHISELSPLPSLFICDIMFLFFASVTFGWKQTFLRPLNRNLWVFFQHVEIPWRGPHKDRLYFKCIYVKLDLFQ